jgi:uncharacterized membrane protein YfcA
VSLQDLLLVPLGLVAGAYGTIIGAGGGFVLVPALLLLFQDKPADQLTSISLTVVLIAGVSASVAYARQRRIDYVAASLMGVAAIPSAALGAFAIHLLPRPVFDVVFGVLLLGVGALAVHHREAFVDRDLPPGPGVLHREISGADATTYRFAFRVRDAAALSSSVAFFSSLLGIGGGVVRMPAMTGILSIPMPVAVPTSTLIGVFISGTAVIVHVIDGHLTGGNAAIALLLAPGALAGAQLGAFLSPHLATNTVTRLLVVALVLVGVHLILLGTVGGTLPIPI